jgi:hypothetical protein
MPVPNPHLGWQSYSKRKNQRKPPYKGIPSLTTIGGGKTLKYTYNLLVFYF